MRKLAVSALIATMLVVLAPLSANSASAQAAEEASFVAAINNVRSSAGLPALTVHGELTGLSRNWAQSMASAGQISHASPISAGLTAPWLKLGENVGVGPSVTALIDAFVASPGHFANLVDPEFTHVGVGVVWVGDVMYTTHRFMKLETTAPPPPPPPPPPTTTTVLIPVSTTSTVAINRPTPTSEPATSTTTTTEAPTSSPTPTSSPSAVPADPVGEPVGPLPLFGPPQLQMQRINETLIIAYDLLP